ncbi:MAG: FecR family protein [Gammaproteobacteria bacterium]
MDSRKFHNLARPLPAALCLLSLTLGTVAAPPALGEPAGKVLYANGAATAAQPGGELRFLGKGMPLEQGDTVTTGKRGFVILHMVDDGKMTLRPNTELRIDQYEERRDGSSVALELLRGGLRSLSGLFSRRRPDSYRLKAGVATVGIRGTEFDVRLCEADCAAGQKDATKPRARSAEPLAGRLILKRGEVSAQRPGETARMLATGSRVYMGDAIVTGPKAVAAIVFRDDSRIVLRARSEFVIDRYFYEPEEPAPSTFLRLVRGGLRALTGLAARRNPGGFRLSTRTATIGIRGTGFDVVTDEHCEEGRALSAAAGAGADDCTFVSVWQGAVDTNGDTLESGETGFVADEGGAVSKLDETPGFMADSDAPRPDQLDADLDELFGTAPADGGEPGIYISVNEGETIVETPSGEVSLTRGEAARVDPATGDLTRLSGQPLFLLDDPYPSPSKFDDEIERAFDLFGDDIEGFNNRDSLECRIN